ncbi:MAG: multicopper oxidase family protein [Anaerolineales bacterium]
MRKTRIDRRQFLRYLGYGGVFLASQPILSACRPFFTDRQTAEIDDPDVEIQLTAKPDVQQIFPGLPTKIWRYQGEVIKGPPGSLITLPDSYLGPIFQITTGTRLRVNFVNEIPESSIIHWHGLHVPELADGHPRFAIENGETYQYDFQVMDRAGTYWYHPHPHGRTGPQVYQGLAGLFVIHDDEEASLALPSQDKDLPLVIQDRAFDDDNQLVYGTFLLGMLGDRILVNGLPDYKMEVDRTAYRLRLMNGSNARIYKLAWKDGTPLQVIGTEGGLLERPLIKDYITLAPAQRLDLWVDFGAWDPGHDITMVNLPSGAPDSQEAFPIFSASIRNTERVSAPLPEVFPSHRPLDVAQADNIDSPRVFELSMGMGMQWMINGRTFEMTEVAGDERVRLGDIELWEFRNTGDPGIGMMGGMAQPHPMHVHGLQFKIIDRQLNLVDESDYNSLKDGFVDEGWHDTVLVMPGERVRIAMRFEDFAGLYLYHCHNLEHEDMGMMRNYQVD